LMLKSKAMTGEQRWRHADSCCLESKCAAPIFPASGPYP
jgi:hypothetical protein